MSSLHPHVGPLLLILRPPPVSIAVTKTQQQPFKLTIEQRQSGIDELRNVIREIKSDIAGSHPQDERRYHIRFSWPGIYIDTRQLRQNSAPSEGRRQQFS